MTCSNIDNHLIELWGVSGIPADSNLHAQLDKIERQRKYAAAIARKVTAKAAAMRRHIMSYSNEEILNEIQTHGSIREGAIALGLSRSDISKRFGDLAADHPDWVRYQTLKQPKTGRPRKRGKR